MSFTDFTNQQLLPFFISAICLIISIFLFHSGKQKQAVIILFTGALLLGFFICSLDHFLILWDEQFHALVAKNLTENPAKPTLYKLPVLAYDYKNWTANHVWLHKQPLFLWQMALSIKLFGISALSVRIPGIILHALISLFIYRIGKISINANAGFYGALFFCVASYPLELIAGRHATDQNDIAFLFYITASFWAWFEYKESKKYYWILLVGVFSGCAVLVKWLVGLMIYGVWLISTSAENRGKRFSIKSYFPMVYAFAVTCLVFIPWQVYILYSFPVEAKYELQFNASHFFSALEDHGGDWWFHFKALKELYGSLYFIPFLLAGMVALFKSAGRKVYLIALVVPVAFTYVFFTVAATKMASFCLIASPFLFIGLGTLTDLTINAIQSKIRFRYIGKLLPFVLPLSVSFLLIDCKKIVNFHSAPYPEDHYPRKDELAQMDFIHKLKTITHNEQYVVFNASIREKGYVPVMFYTNCIAYDYIPDEKQVSEVRMKGFKMAILVKDSVPGYIMNDKNILKIEP